nr:hypothetical protein [uncultured Deefgea sp.]
MIDNYSRVCCLLAASAISEKDLIDFINACKDESASQTIKNIRNFRSKIDFAGQTPRESNKDVISKHELTDNPVVSKVEQLLIHEANMSKTEAIAALTNALIDKKILPPASNKRGLAAWIELLLKKVPASEVLYLATNIRNQYVHTNERSDWSIR